MLSTRRRVMLAVTALVVLAGCGEDADAPAATSTGAEVRPFSEVQATDFAFEGDPLDPGRGIFRVETTEPMICAIVWGETEDLGRFNNSLSMNGTGIEDHDVVLPDAVPGTTYDFIVQGTTADGTLYRSEPGTFTIPDEGGDTGDDGAGTALDLGPNLATGADVIEVSSEFSESFAGEAAVDGDLATEWSTAGDGDDGSITIDLGEAHEIATVDFVTRSMADGTAITSTYTVQIDDGEVLGPFPAGSPRTPRPSELGVTGRVVRFDVVESSGGNVGAVEIGAYGPSS